MQDRKTWAFSCLGSTTSVSPIWRRTRELLSEKLRPAPAYKTRICFQENHILGCIPSTQTFPHPFKDKRKSISSTQQNHLVKQQSIYVRNLCQEPLSGISVRNCQELSGTCVRNCQEPLTGALMDHMPKEIKRACIAIDSTTEQIQKTTKFPEVGKLTKSNHEVLKID